MSARTRNFLLVLLFIATPVLLYFIDYLYFRDTKRIFIQIVDNLAFVPLSVFVVAIVINRLLAERERQARIHRMNMVVGAFFSEVGNSLLKSMVDYFKKSTDFSREAAVTGRWTDAELVKAARVALNLARKANYQDFNLTALKVLLVSRRQFLLTLLENPNLLEHEGFTDLLGATFHLTEELETRQSLNNPSEADMRHLSADIERMHLQLVNQWLSYVKHLKTSYPYLYSLTLRVHPFQENPSAVVES
jgi:hypothetical protein